MCYVASCGFYNRRRTQVCVDLCCKLRISEQLSVFNYILKRHHVSFFYILFYIYQCPVPENSNEFCADVTSPDYCTGVNECKGLNCNICGDEFTSYFTCLDGIIATGCAGFSPCDAKNVAAVKSFLRHA